MIKLLINLREEGERLQDLQMGLIYI